VAAAGELEIAEGGEELLVLLQTSVISTGPEVCAEEVIFTPQPHT
jgi:hypothetical protein